MGILLRPLIYLINKSYGRGLSTVILTAPTRCIKVAPIAQSATGMVLGGSWALIYLRAGYLLGRLILTVYCIIRKRLALM